MKKLLAVCAAAALIGSLGCSSAFASPLKNYDAGKFAIDAGLTIPTNMKLSGYKLSKSNSGYAGATVGLGKNMALNYQWDNYKCDEGRTRAQQLNLNYKLLPGLAAYVGYMNIDTKGAGHSDKENSGHIGLVAAYDIPLLFTVWGKANVGIKNSGYELGLSKALFNNLELNASYFNHKFDEAYGKDDVKSRGVKLGVTVKF